MKAERLFGAILLICLAQSFFLIYLSSNVKQLDKRVAELSQKTEENAKLSQQNFKSQIHSLAYKMNHISSDNGTPASRNFPILREIIRQELSAQSSKEKKGNEVATGEGESGKMQPEQGQLVAANERLNAIISSGEVNNKEVEYFQSSLSALDTKEQKALLQRFARAINSGEVKLSQ
ncbi:hypothetical protein [Aliikangiella sp. G2MR2-5]|uniref:hypothetical protein n=1 Tax=Aliikangiella sp. G2MR2-5 TaxID=2788943 RepID=UPI0018AA9466|nr:hypothetical protein [Aliikangiella sp. G2MR2-5]